jgi:hypothetical protein
LPAPANDREALLVKLIAAVMANATSRIDGKIDINVTSAMEMVDKVLVEFEVLKIGSRQ